MMRIGLSGGIGSGKSTVSAYLAGLGAFVIDADQIAREVVAQGTPGLAQIREQFGGSVIAPDGTLDRPALGAIVFADPDRRTALEAITHPLIAERTAQLFAAAGDDAIVIHDMPLLVEIGQTDRYHLMMIVDVPEELRLQRLVEHRGMSRDDARARMRAQASDDQRRAVADVLVDNSGSKDELIDQLNSLWHTRVAPYADNLAHDHSVRRPSVVMLREYDPQWAATGERLRRRIAYQLGQLEGAFGVDHIGSTAVPGLAAKDVIDLQVRVPNLGIAHGEQFRTALRDAGIVELRSHQDHPQSWAPNPDDWRKLYAGGADPAQVVHVHVRAADGPAAQIALQFRDWLRAEEVERGRYEAMKRTAAIDHPGGTQETRADYGNAKEPWFALNFVRARDWADRSGWSMPN